ncbi:hypothetical protein R6Q59_001927 [Mikania micrantha]
MIGFRFSNRSLNDDIIVLLLLLSSFSLMCSGIRYFPVTGDTEIQSRYDVLCGFTEAPEYRNGAGCSPATIHVAMTIDLEYLRGSIAAVHSVLRHASCPESVFFHFIAAEFDPASPRDLTRLVRSTFPSLMVVAGGRWRRKALKTLGEVGKKMMMKRLFYPSCDRHMGVLTELINGVSDKGRNPCKIFKKRTLIVIFEVKGRNQQIAIYIKDKISNLL